MEGLVHASIALPHPQPNNKLNKIINELKEDTKTCGADKNDPKHEQPI